MQCSGCGYLYRFVYLVEKLRLFAWPTPQPPRTGPLTRARRILLGLEPHHGVEQAAAPVTAGPFIGGQRAKIIGGARVRSIN